MSYHTPVLCEEALDALAITPGGIYVDGTVGGGGHAFEVCKKLNGVGRLICFDADADALRAARKRLQEFGERVTLVHANFGGMKEELAALGVSTVNGILLDLGVSSYQLDEGSKGFSFRSNDRLDMRMDRRQSLSAMQVLNEYEEEKLARIIFLYGEEKNSRKIARAIVNARPLDTTGSLVDVLEHSAGGRFLTKTLARVFQAIRIEVNGELDNLTRGLVAGTELLSPGGRFVVISYHSLEDRIVKDFFRDASAAWIRSGHKYIPDTKIDPRLLVLTKRPVTADEIETKQNPRARSAKMRVAEKFVSK